MGMLPPKDAPVLNPDDGDDEVETEVVRAKSYDKKADGQKGVRIPAGELARDEDITENRERLHSEVKAVVSRILEDRGELLQRIKLEQERQASFGGEVILDDPVGILGTRLFELWNEQGIDTPHVALYEGMCAYERHSWFRAEMSVMEIGEPDYFWLIDPFGRGVSTINHGTFGPVESDFLVIKPWSPISQLYAGKMIGTLGIYCTSCGKSISSDENMPIHGRPFCGDCLRVWGPFVLMDCVEDAD